MAATGGAATTGDGVGGGNTGAVTVRDPPPGNRRDHIPRTPFSILYRSIFSIQAATDPARAPLLARLAHVNCNYLSTTGVPPNLLQLNNTRKHWLFSSRTSLYQPSPASSTMPILGSQAANKRLYSTMPKRSIFLNDLTTLYTGPREQAFLHHHKLPLHALMNILGATEQCQDGEPVPGAPETICPFHEIEPSDRNGKNLPYAHRESLIYHANEILELLDHEYSPKGGILAILPDKNSKDPKEREQYKLSQTTLLGQMVQHIQRLVMRIHDLERVYSNALDALAGEAAVPPQQLSKLGSDGRKGRDLVFPQDRFVLANCGQDVWDYLDYEFTKKENADEANRLMYKQAGAIGSDLWRRQGKKEYERGITVLDVNTRYIRLRKDPLKTVFVIPAYENHPGTKATRDLEKVPTVVSVVKPIWPERASIWEMKNRDKMAELNALKDSYAKVNHELEVATNARDILSASEKQYRAINADLRRKLNECLESNKPDETEALAALRAEKEAAEQAKKECDDMKAQVVAQKAQLDDLIRTNATEAAEWANAKANFATARSKPGRRSSRHRRQDASRADARSTNGHQRARAVYQARRGVETTDRRDEQIVGDLEPQKGQLGCYGRRRECGHGCLAHDWKCGVVAGRGRLQAFKGIACFGF